MIETLLVDDNQLALNQFNHSIDWKKYGFKVIAEAYNGNDAFREFMKFYPKVVITDIQMPGLSGIELTKRIKEIAPDTIILFLSNYEEFTYVRSALNLGVFDYILKSENNSHMIYDKLDKVRQYIKDSKNKNTLYKEGSFASLLSEVSLKEMDKDLVNQFYKIFPNTYSLFLISQQHILPVISQLTGEYTEAVEEAVLKRLLYSFNEDIIAVIKVEKYRYLALCRTDAYSHCIEAVDLQEYLPSDFFVLPLCEKNSIDACIKHFDRDKDQSRDMFFYPTGTVLSTGLTIQEAEPDITIDYEEVKKLQVNFQFDKLCYCIDKYYPLIHRKKDYSVLSDLTKFLLEELLTFHNQVFDFKKGLTFSVIDNHARQYWSDGYSVMQWLREKYLLLHSFVQSSSYLKYSKSVQYAMKHVYNHYMDPNLTIEMIAADADLSVNHLNKIMKKELDITIGKYLTKVRMDKARELMEDGFTVTNIYPRVGYISLAAFSRAFKNTFDISPQDYKRQLI